MDAPLAEAGLAGVFNAIGPTEPLTLGELVERIRSGSATLVWADERWLLAEGVKPFTDLPLWLAPNADPDWADFLSVDVAKAAWEGLRFRPLEETVATRSSGRCSRRWARRTSASRSGAGRARTATRARAARRLRRRGVNRERFSALDRPTAFLDGPAGTQVPDSVIEAIAAYLRGVEREPRRAVRDELGDAMR